jgi:uncharacterized protein YkwD
MKRLHRFIMISIVLAGMLAITSTAFAGNDCGSSCVKVALMRSNLVGDFYAGDVLVQSQTGDVTLLASSYGGPGSTLQVTARNIHDGTADDGVYYSYPDTSRTIRFPTSSLMYGMKLLTRPAYIRARLTVGCDMRQFTGGDVACLLRIDGTNIATIGAGQTASFPLDPGTHQVDVLMAGSEAGAWSPAIVSKIMTVKARSVPYRFKATFRQTGQNGSPDTQPTTAPSVTATTPAVTATPVTPTPVTPTPVTPTPVTPTAAPLPSSGADYTVYDDGAAMLYYVNYARCSSGLSPLTLNAQLTSAATKFSISMAVNNFFSHYGLDGSDPGTRISAEGYNWITYGENIAAGYAGVQDTFMQWWNSPGHKANILNANFREMGLGHVHRAAADYQDYWTQDFGSTGTAPGVCP